MRDDVIAVDYRIDVDVLPPRPGNEAQQAQPAQQPQQQQPPAQEPRWIEEQ